jgi:hypothetical protein
MRKVPAALIVLVATAAASCGTERERAAATIDSPPSSAPPPDPGAMDSLKPIPAAFWGRWTGERYSCARLAADVDMMYLEPAKVIFWKSFAQVREVAVIDSSRLFLDLEHHEFAESSDANPENRGTAQRREMSLALSADQLTLTAIDSGKGVQVRHRCPSDAESEKARE